MGLPALEALDAAGDLIVRAPAWGRALYRDLRGRVLPLGDAERCEVAITFAPSLRSAWQIRRGSRRIGTATDARSWLLTDRVPADGHGREVAARLVAVLGLRAVGPPQWRPRRDDEGPRLPWHVGLNPVSRSGAVRQWPGFAALAARLSGPVVVYAGPGEEEQARRVAGRWPVVAGLALPALAAALSTCRLLVSNDTGVAHFARAAGVPTLVLHGSTTARRSGPDGALALEGPEVPCRPCYRRVCVNRLECLEIPVDVVLQRVREEVGGGLGLAPLGAG
jgi:ADP-heptose:LPS heptosyltransferase